ncbi:MAG: hypothetical protein DI581_06665 [Staphylococcus capitis]|nr:hypothetical protein CD038_06260 [Staphylococcus capitis subsp. capitis]PZP94535.1 MAG: hypothetical protein DI581_06665 [Staphylococcus capitis]
MKFYKQCKLGRDYENNFDKLYFFSAPFLCEYCCVFVNSFQGKIIKNMLGGNNHGIRCHLK